MNVAHPHVSIETPADVFLSLLEVDDVQHRPDQSPLAMTAYLKPSLFSPSSLPTIPSLPSLPSFGKAGPNPGKLPYDLAPSSSQQPSRPAMPLFSASSAKTAAAGAWKGFGGSSSNRDGGAGERQSSASSSAGAMIKCSDCGREVALDELGEHVCAPVARRQMDQARAPRSPAPQLRRDPMRVEIPQQRDFSNRPYPQTPQAYTQSPSTLTPPNYFPSFKPGDIIPSGMTRSASASSATSTGSTNGRMPFFEKYAQYTGASPTQNGSPTWGVPATLNASPSLTRFHQPPPVSVHAPPPRSASSGSQASSSTSSSSPSSGSERDVSSAATSPALEYPDEMTPDTSPEVYARKALARAAPQVPAGRQPALVQRRVEYPPPQARPNFPPPTQPAAPRSDASAGVPRPYSPAQSVGRLYPGGSANGLACKAPSTLAGGRKTSGASRYRRPVPTGEEQPAMAPVREEPDEVATAGGGLGLVGMTASREDEAGSLKKMPPAGGWKLGEAKKEREGGGDGRMPSSNQGSVSSSSSSSLSSRFRGVGLEGLMGDLMAEMEPGQSGEEAKEEADDDIIDFTAAYGDSNETPRASEVATMPSLLTVKRSPGDLRPDDSISQRDPLRSPTYTVASSSCASLDPSRCHRCRKVFPPDATDKDRLVRPVSDRGSAVVAFCKACYADLYLPKCRRCDLPIERGAVTDRVGKVLGKYHPKCFTCVECSEKFETGEFYVWERNPVCYKHYHQRAGTTCCNETCGQGIEGPCVALSLSDAPQPSSDDAPLRNNEHRRLYHPEHFTCSRLRCGVSLHEFHFVVAGRPWCERHAVEEEERQAAEEERKRRVAKGGGAAAPRAAGTERAKKRRTVLMNVKGK